MSVTTQFASGPCALVCHVRGALIGEISHDEHVNPALGILSRESTQARVASTPKPKLRERINPGYHSPSPQINPRLEFLRDPATGAVTLAADAMLDRFTSDLDRLSANDGAAWPADKSQSAGYGGGNAANDGAWRRVA